MAEPLTWRNLQGFQGSNRDFLDAANMVEQSGLGGLNKALVGYQKQQGDIFASDQARNYQTLQESLRSQFKTPEELQAAINSGAVNQMMSSYGDRIDRSKGISFADAQVKDLRNTFSAEETFKNLKAKAAAAPILDNVNALYTAGKFAEGDALAASNSNLLGSFKADLAKARLNADESQMRLGVLKRSEEVSIADQRRKLLQTGADTTAVEKTIVGQKEDAIVDNTVKKVFEDFEASKRGVTEKIKAISSMPTFANYAKDENGLVDVSKLTRDQSAMWAGMLQKKGVQAPDASLAAKQVKDILSASNIDPARVQTGLEKINKVVTNKPVVSAENQAELDRAVAATAAAKEDHKKNNLFYFDPKSYTEDIAPVFSKISTEIKDSEGTKERIKTKISEWTTKGIEYVDPTTQKTARVVVPANLLNAAYEATKVLDEWKIFENETDNNMEKYIKDVLENKQYAKAREEADQFSAGVPDLQVRNLRNAIQGKTGKENPATYLDRAMQQHRDTAAPTDQLSLQLAKLKQDAEIAAVKKAELDRIESDAKYPKTISSGTIKRVRDK
jgi:hypothetical protein